MANFSKVLGIATSAVVFAGMAFGQSFPTCTSGVAAQSPLIRVEGTTELVGEYQMTCGSANTIAASANILDIVSLPVTSKVVNTSSSSTEAAAVVSVGGTIVGTPVLGTIAGSTVTFTNVSLPAGVSQVNIVNIRVNATTLSVGSGTPPPVTESTFVSTVANNTTLGSTPGSVSVAYGFTGLGTQSVYNTLPIGSKTGTGTFLVCSAYKTNAGLAGVVDVKEGFATAFKGQGSSNTTLGSEFTANTETGFTGITAPVSNVASSATLLAVTFAGIPAEVSALYLPLTVNTDQSGASPVVPGTGTLSLVTSPTNLAGVTAATSSSAPTVIGFASSSAGALTVASGSATAYYLFTPGTASNTTTESFSIPAYIVQAANATGAVTGTMTESVSFAPIGSTSIPNFVVGSSTTTATLATFNLCATNLLFPFITNQLGFDTGIAIANTSVDPFGSKGAVSQTGTCVLSFYGSGAPSPNTITTPAIGAGATPATPVYAFVLSSVAAGFQGYMIAQCNFQYGHGFAFVEDGLGTSSGIVQGYLANVIPDVNITGGRAASPSAIAGAGSGESLGQ